MSWTSHYLATYNPNATINFFKLSPGTILWLNSHIDFSKLKKFLEHGVLHGIINFKFILEKFNVYLKIYGYFNPEVMNILDNIASAMSEITTIVFFADYHYVCGDDCIQYKYFGIRLDPFTKKATLLEIINETELFLDYHYESLPNFFSAFREDNIFWKPLEL